MIELTGLSVSIGGAHAVREADLTIRPGDRVGIVGESGSGKSMLALALMGMVPDGLTVTGAIRIDGQDMAGAPDAAWRRHRARRVAMIFQEPMSSLNPLRRIGDTVAEPLIRHLGLPRRAARARALALLEETGLPEADRRMRQYPHELSGGQRQRVLIALALACDPELLIADEPTTALDAGVALRITELLVRLSRERRMALLLISHDLAAVARTTEQIAVMYGGDIVERGPTDRVLGAPAHPYTQGLLAARPRIAQAAGPRQPLPTIPGAVPQLADLPAGCRFAGRCSQELPHCARWRPAAMDLPAGGQAACHLLAQGARPAQERQVRR